MKHSILIWLLIVCLALSLLPACGARRAPDLARIFAKAGEVKGKRPLIIVPGILGSRLVNRINNEVVWESALRSKTDDLALPVSGDLRANRDDLVARDVIESARLLRRAPEIYVYRELVEALENQGGYRRGNWETPSADGDTDTFYLFAYDWRRDNVESAQELIRKIESLKAKLNRPDLQFNIVAHSMGGLVARYAAMYGAQELAENQAVTWAGARHINKVFLFGAPNLGSADAFASLLDGYSIREGLRRRVPLFRNLTKKDAFTIPSLYQLLPHGAALRFLDENLQPMAVDLYDAATWRRYGWGVGADEHYRRRFVAQSLNRQAGVDEGEGSKGESRKSKIESRARTEGIFGSEGYSPEAAAGSSLANLDGYFEAVLKRAKAFHQALDVRMDASSPVEFFVLGGDCEETLAAPVILKKSDGRFQTLIEARAFRSSSNVKFSRRTVELAMYAPGDGRVTRNSLLASNNAITSFIFPNENLVSIFACDLHGDVQKNKVLQDNALTLILREAIK